MTSKMDDNDFAITRKDLYGTTPETTYAGVTSFMRRKYTRDLSGVDVAVTGVPFDTSTTNRPGARFGPRAIRSASTIMAWEKPYGMAFDPFDKLAVADVGDCLFDHGKPDSVPAAIEAHATNIISQGTALLTLGGDHFITYPILKAHAALHGAPLYSDTWRDEDARVDHGTMFYWAVREGIVDPAASIQVGLRTENPDTQGFNIIDAPAVHDRGVASVIEEVRHRLGDGPVYVTFDIDCLDPAYAPGTGTPVCGGLTTHQAMAILRGLAGINVIGMDVVEVAPAYDIGEITSLAASHIAMEVLYLHACAQAGS
jgi:agmatinase